MIEGLLIMGVLGVLCGAGLAVASKIFYVYVDPKIEAVEEALPGANCGGCGYPGCSANAAAIVAGKSSPSSCVAGGPDIAEEIAAILGVKVEAREPDIAAPGCSYGYQDADLKYLYDGVRDCRAAVLLNGGSKVCPIGCLGLGTCVRACPFDALSMGPDNLPVVDPDLCTGCGTCERVCPRHIITLTSNSRRIQKEYTTDDCTAPCQRSCPAGINIPAYIREIREGNYLEAVRIIKETNPFPLVCGRICVHPCEYVCRRNLVDEPVAINHLKRFAADFEMKSGERVQVPRAPETGKRIAVVGGGAEGLTAAYFLNRLGHEATVYEGAPYLGGLLRSGIPQNRLPWDVLDYEINGILEAGVQAVTNKKLGRDFTMDSLLKQGYLAVFIATGGWDARLLGKDHDEALRVLPGVGLLVDFLLAQRGGTKLDLGEHVMIVEGGKSALEASRICLEQGGKSVHLVFRNTIEHSPFSEDEIRKAEQQGIEFHFEAALTKMVGEGSSLNSVEISYVADEEQKQTIEIDSLLTGAGRFPELIYVPRVGEGEEGAEIQSPVPWETLVPYPSPFAEQDVGIFRPGEPISDYEAVVEAIGAGRRGASSIQHYLTGEEVKAPEHMIRKNTQVLSLDKLEPVPEAPREKMPERPAEEQLANPDAEIALGYTEDQALREANRCLQCGLICYRRVEKSLH
ncbi:MAG: FAD-dependent oxidoreductase [Deltaproteobacteria bacterium]|nr:FAD-dependent oxidoreductase [Deltaproteobacteria bacterium]MBW1918719.1 FAD-dependent oxidoreductase [Deltaproteobacteria bacterium]MBW1934506.1 FAD-dependent oxidoreductase [Deltaproteobacteria bacterium]